MDELFEALTLIQTKKVENFPVVLVGVEYWAPLVAMLDRLAAEGAIAAKDRDLVLVTDDLDLAMRHLQVHAVERFGLRARRVPQAKRWLGEKAFAGSTPGR